ncbi:unnamed protein product [Amoebophrya sp. A25]|nr:unnamed protein product [Amoebophrya sp. A25]|eukprot:GSA25T00007114001.1
MTRDLQPVRIRGAKVREFAQCRPVTTGSAGMGAAFSFYPEDSRDNNSRSLQFDSSISTRRGNGTGTGSGAGAGRVGFGFGTSTSSTTTFPSLGGGSKNNNYKSSYQDDDLSGGWIDMKSFYGSLTAGGSMPSKPKSSYGTSRPAKTNNSGGNATRAGHALVNPGGSSATSGDHTTANRPSTTPQHQKSVIVVAPGERIPPVKGATANGYAGQAQRGQPFPPGGQHQGDSVQEQDEKQGDTANATSKRNLHERPFTCDAKLFRGSFDDFKGRKKLSPEERQIQAKLDNALKKAAKENRFDAMVKSDGTFKRQVWAEMIKEGLIGYNKTTKKAQVEMGARDAPSFLKLLVRRFGTIMRAWRNGLDMDGNGRISYFEFCKAARAIGYESSLRQLWNELNDNDDKAFITLDELDRETFDRINYFNDLLTAKYSSLLDAWRSFDSEKQQQIYEKRFREVLTTKLGFDENRFSIEKLYKDLDYDGNGFLTIDDWMFLKKWVTTEDLRMLEDFRKALQRQHFKPADAFHKIFDVNGNGSIDPKEFVDGCKKLKLLSSSSSSSNSAGGNGAPRSLSFNPRRVFEVLDADESGEISVSEFIKLFSATEENKVTAIDEHNPLPAIQKEIQNKFGCEVQLEELEPPLKKSFQLYDAVFRRLEEKERQDLHDLMRYNWDANADGASKGGAELPDVQELSDLDLLLEQAMQAQGWLKRQVMEDPKRPWPTRTYNRGNLKPPFHEAFDPGIKGRRRCLEKATYKYEAQYGQQKFRRLRDMARLSLHFEKCKDLLVALRELPKFFTVIQLDNRMRFPTALGWRDFAALVLGEDDEGKKHICEIQLQLSAYTKARETAHQHYRALREKIPLLVGNKQAEALQEAILDALQCVRQRDFSSHVQVGVDMDRSKVWTQPWQKNPTVTTNVRNTRRAPKSSQEFPENRPELPIVSMRTAWMRENLAGAGSFPPAVPDLRDNRPWLPAGGLQNGLFTNFAGSEINEARDGGNINHGGGVGKQEAFENFDQRLAQLEYEAGIRKLVKANKMNKAVNGSQKGTRGAGGR